jgi:hypothetical protein
MATDVQTSVPVHDQFALFNQAARGPGVDVPQRSLVALLIALYVQVQDLGPEGPRNG